MGDEKHESHCESELEQTGGGVWMSRWDIGVRTGGIKLGWMEGESSITLAIGLRVVSQ